LPEKRQNLPKVSSRALGGHLDKPGAERLLVALQPFAGVLMVGYPEISQSSS
jgi:hypothetical protein